MYIYIYTLIHEGYTVPSVETHCPDFLTKYTMSAVKSKTTQMDSLLSLSSHLVTMKLEHL